MVETPVKARATTSEKDQNTVVRIEKRNSHAVNGGSNGITSL